MKRPTLLFLFTSTIAVSAQESPTNEAAALYTQAIAHMKAGEHHAAVNAFSRYLVLRPELSKAWYYRGVCRHHEADLAGAAHDLERCLALQPRDANARLRLCDVYTAQGKTNEAISGLSALLMDHPHGPIAEHALFSLGHAHVNEGDHASALAAYERLVNEAPANAKAWFDRGVAKSQLKDLEGAIADMSKALELDPTLANAYANRAVALIHAERKAEACPDLKKASALGDTSVAEMMAIYCD